MVAQPYWINAHLAIVPRPRGGDWLDDEMQALRLAGIDVIVSMIEPAEAEELGLDREGSSARRTGMEFVSFPIQDRTTPPDLDLFDRFLAGLEQNMAEGKRIGIHCRGSIGRSSVVAASLLIRAGTGVEETWRQIEVARGCHVPDTPEQFEWVNRRIRQLK